MNQLYAFFDRLDLKIAGKLAIAAILSLYLSFTFDYYFEHPDFVIADLWCVMTSVIVLQTTIGGTYKAIWFRFIGVLIGSIIGVIFVMTWGAGAASMGMAIVLTVVICAIFQIPDSYRLAALSVIVIMLPWKAHPEHSPWAYAFFRFIDTCIGFISAIIVSHFLWPSLALNKIRTRMANRVDFFRQFLNLVRSQSSSEENQKQLKDVRKVIDETWDFSSNMLEESKMELIMRSELLGTWIELIKYQALLWESLRLIRKVYTSKLDEAFDEELRKHVHDIMEMVDLALQALELELTKNHTTFDFTSFQELQLTMQHQRVRFRATQRIRNYGLDVVEDYFVFFYELNQIMVRLQKLHELLDSL